MPAIERGENVAMRSHGFGKTLAYLLPIINEMMDEGAERFAPTSVQAIRALVVAPSQELAMQIVRQVEKILGDLEWKILWRSHRRRQQRGREGRRYEETAHRRRHARSFGRVVSIRESCRRTVCERSSWTRRMICWRATLGDMARISEHTGKGVPGETDGHRERDAETRDWMRTHISRRTSSTSSRRTINQSRTPPPSKTTTRRGEDGARQRRKERLRGGATSANAGCRQSSTAYHALFCRIRASTQG